VNHHRYYCAVASLLVACGSSGPDTQEFSVAEKEIVATLGPLPELPASPTNAHADDPGAAKLGQKLFFESSYSGAIVVPDDGSNGGLGAVGEKGKVACASCHVPSNWFMDARSSPNNVSLGVAYTPRNAPSLVNAAYYKWFGWGGKQESLWMQAAGSPESKDNTAGNRLQYAHMLFSKYRADYDAVFSPPLAPALDPAAADAARFPAQGKPKATVDDSDGAWEMMAADDRAIVMRIMSNVGKSIEAYERLLVSRNSAFERFVLGDESALSPAARRGVKLFIGKAACVACHSGPTLTDNDFHATGVPQTGRNVPASDDGHFSDVKKLLENKYSGTSVLSDDVAAGAAKIGEVQENPADAGKFRTKSLFQVAETAPYMHNGSMATLEDVIDFYNRGGDSNEFASYKDARMRPLNLGTSERADLLAFLKSLTGDPVSESLSHAPPD
jgi:cytochrome c peroxidase